AALFGLLLYFTTAALFLLAVRIFDPSGLPFLLFFLVPGLIVLAAVVFIRRWGLIVGVLGGLLGLLAFSEDLDVALTSPYSFLDFAGTIIVLTGIVILLVASVLGLIESFRSTPRTSARAWE